MNNIGNRIKQKRLENKWSQEELAKRMGYKTKSTIAKIESGVNDVSQKKISKFAEVLDVPISYLMDWNDTKTNERKLIDLKEVRINRNISLMEAAKEFNISEKELKEYEERIKPIPKHLLKLFKKYYQLEKDLHTIEINNGEIIFSKEPKYMDQITMWQKEIGDVELTDDELKQIMDFAKFLISKRNKGDK